MAKFSNKTMLYLIKLVSEQPGLYDPTSPNFKSIKTRAVIWDKIGAKLKKTGEACKKRWIDLKKSYDHFKKGGRVITHTKRSSTNAERFKQMAFLDSVEKEKTKPKQSNGNQQPNNENQQQRNGNQQPNNENQQQSNGNQQPNNENQHNGNGNQQPNNENQQQSNGNQQPNNENQQQSNGNQQLNNENQQQSYENNLGLGNPGVQNNPRPESSRTDAVSESNNRVQQYSQSTAQVNVSVGSVICGVIPQLFPENSPVAGPKPVTQRKIEGKPTSTTSKAQKKEKGNAPKMVTTKKRGIIKRKTNKKTYTTPKRRSLNSKGDGLEVFCIQVRTILEELPSGLQIKAQTAVFTTLNSFKEMALASASTSNATV